MTFRAVLPMAMLVLVACDRKPDAPESTSAATDAKATEAEPRAEGHFYPARRCGECHGRQRQEWNQSAHARATDAQWEALVLRLPAGEHARCQGCHRPLAEGGPRVAREGVGCDACHTAIGEAAPPKMVALAPERATRFGPYKDSKDHNFHRVAYSEFVAGGALCATCHQDPAGRTVPEYTTVAEWNAVPDRKACPECHMPSFRAVAAKGEQTRDVSRHDFHPDKAAATKAALDLELKLSATEAQVALTNTGAQHALPTGRPERRLRLELTWRDAEGRTVGSAEEPFGRVLVDRAGALAPSFAAAREASDRRLLPNVAWTGTFARPPGAAKLSVRVFYDPFDRALSSFFGSVDPVLVLEREEAL